MTKKYKPYDKIMCRIKIRPEYEGRKARPKVQELNGQVLLMQVLWLQDSDDNYPGEYALEPCDREIRSKWFEGTGIGWISSGDVEILESAHLEENDYHSTSRIEFEEFHKYVVMTEFGDRLNRKSGFGFLVKGLAKTGTETIIISGNSFKAYNKLMTKEEILEVIKCMDAMDRMGEAFHKAHCEIPDED